jgi:hypothetical protein
MNCPHCGSAGKAFLGGSGDFHFECRASFWKGEFRDHEGVCSEAFRVRRLRNRIKQLENRLKQFEKMPYRNLFLP